MGGNSPFGASLWEAKCSYPTSGISACTWKMSPHSMWLWNPQGSIYKMQKALVNREGLLKDSCALIHPTAECKSSSLKSFQILCEIYVFVHLKAFTRGEGAYWDISLEMEALMDSIFMLSLYLAKSGRHHFFFLMNTIFTCQHIGTILMLSLVQACLIWQPPSFLSFSVSEVYHLHILSLPCSTVPVTSQRGTFMHISCHSFCSSHSGDTPWSPSSSEDEHK